MKTYIDAELQVVRMKDNNIILTSIDVNGEVTDKDATGGIIQAGAGERRFDDWDAGY